MQVELGTIEGFYGKPWTWEEREETARFLAPHGYSFYLYAPKADLFLRRRWREAHPAAEAASLERFGEVCRGAGVRFGVGLSPFELYLEWDAAGRAALDEKLDRLDAFGVQDLAILFDDMRGDVPELAERQAEIVAAARERTSATRLIVCPSYYSDDPILDRAFGQRPEGYLERLGELLDPSVEIFWTGEEVCSREFTPGHLDDVARRLGRRPFLWDNYPVNDGQRMSQYLHLRGFTGRGSGFADHVSAHAINPALQPVLSRIPALTLVDAYRDGPRYRYGDSTTRACIEVLGEELGMKVRQDVLTVQDIGLDLLGARAELLRERYTGVDHPGAREIIAWLDGAYRITDEIVHTQ